MENQKKMQFYGGTFGACLPLLVFMALMITIAALQKVSLVLFCMAGFAGLCTAFLLAKDKKEFEKAVVAGLKNDTLCVIIFAFLLAGVLSQELRQSGLIQGLTWLVTELGLSAGFLPLVGFIICALISTACGTSNGAIVAVLPVLLPVATTVGANPAVVVGAIVSGAIFGDNLAPISDTTIASALTQGAEVRDVVRTRLPYSLIAGVVSAVLFVIIGFRTSEAVTLPELVDAAQWFVTRLNTNGQLLTPELCAKLYDASLDSVQVTLYSADPTVHNALVGVDGFDKTVQGIRNAVAAGLIVSVNTPLCSLNTDYAATLRFAASLGVRYATCSGLIPSGSAEGAESRATRLTEQELTAVLQDAVSVLEELSMELDFTSPGWLPEETLRALGLHLIPSCGACLSNMAIAPDGSIIPCQSWLSAAPLGNMLTDDWSAVWNSERCAAIRAESARMDHVCQLHTGNREEAATC